MAHVFRKIKTEIADINNLPSTIYHPQTDGQSEKINQTVEITLRYFLTNNPGDDFVNAFPFFQTTINNAVSTATGLVPNEIVYGFRNNDTLKLITDLPPEDFNRLKLIYREQAKKTIIWANSITKHKYDNQHFAINFPINSKAFFRLHHGYTIPGISNKKFNQQRVGPFPITKKIKKLIYELKLPPMMTIHPMISVAQLEPAFNDPNPYERANDRNFPPVTAENDEIPEYEIKKLVGKRFLRNRFQYLVK